MGVTAISCLSGRDPGDDRPDHRAPGQHMRGGANSGPDGLRLHDGPHQCVEAKRGGATPPALPDRRCRTDTRPAAPAAHPSSTSRVPGIDQEGRRARDCQLPSPEPHPEAPQCPASAPTVPAPSAKGDMLHDERSSAGCHHPPAKAARPPFRCNTPPCRAVHYYRNNLADAKFPQCGQCSIGVEGVV